MVSLHGTEETHNMLTVKRNAYQRAISAIQNSLDVGLDVVVEMTLTGKNVQDVLNTIKIVKEMGGQEFRIMRYVPRGKSDNELNVSSDTISELIPQLDKLYGQKDIHIRFPCSPRFCLTSPLVPMIDNNIIEQSGNA